MPTYEYKCLDCEHQFETVQSMKDEPLTECPECTGKVKRMIGTGAGIIFKGTGFYCTDYRSDSYKKSAEGDKKEPVKAPDKPAGEKTTPKENNKAAASTTS